MLDGCEDKPDNDPRYYGMGDWNEYRRQQAEWLKGVVNSDEFRAAPVRIVLMHMIPGKEDSCCLLYTSTSSTLSFVETWQT